MQVQEPEGAFCSLCPGSHVLEAYASGGKGVAAREGNGTNHTPGALDNCVTSAGLSLLNCKIGLSRVPLS